MTAPQEALPSEQQRLLDEAAREYEAAGDPLSRINAGLRFGELLGNAGRYEQALALMERLQALALDEESQARVLRQTGWLYMRQSSFDQAALCLGEALVRLTDHSGSLEMFHVYRDLAWIYYRQGFLEQARNYGEGAHLILQNHAGSGPASDEAWELLHHVMALIESAAGCHAQAIAHLEQERAVIERSSDTSQLGALYNKLSTVHKAQGDFVVALALQRKALELSRNAGDMLRVAVSYKNLGDLYFIMGDLERSQDYTGKFLELNPVINNAIGGAFGHAARARVLLERGDFAGAEGCYQQALAIAREIKGKGREASILNELAELYCRWHKLQAADDHFRQACEIFTEINLSDNQRQLIVKASILTAKAEADGSLGQRMAQLQDALRILDQTLAKPITVDDEEIMSAPELELRALCLVTQVQQLLGRHQKAVESLDRSRAIRDRLASQFEDAARQLFLGRSQFRELAALERTISQMP